MRQQAQLGERLFVSLAERVLTLLPEVQLAQGVEVVRTRLATRRLATRSSPTASSAATTAARARLAWIAGGRDELLLLEGNLAALGGLLGLGTDSDGEHCRRLAATCG